MDTDPGCYALRASDVTIYLVAPQQLQPTMKY